FGHVDIKENRADQGGKGKEQSDFAEAQDEFQRAPVERDDGVEPIFGLAVEPGFFFPLLMAQEFGAHHRSKGERDDRRYQDGDRKSNGKFAEQAADDVTHEQQRYEHSDERNGQRKNGKADLLGTFESGFERRLTFLNVAADIFDHHDSVVDDETRGNGESHER